MSSPAVRCGICESDRKNVVNAFLQAGRTPNWIEHRLREMGSPTKAETVRKHLHRCLNGSAENIALLQEAIPEPGKPAPEVDPRADFAMAIRAEANRKLAAGELTVNAQHGLAAQALIDRREEKKADRQLMVELAGLLSGARSLQGPPEELIEGEWREVTDDPETTALAPLALVAGDE